MSASDLFSIAGKTALVTGGTRGIGRMIAEGFVDAGATVYISSRKADVCRGGGRRALARRAPASASRPTCPPRPSAGAWPTRWRRGWTSLDILVNNAGATWGTPLADFDEAAFERVLALNVKGVFHLTKFLVPLLEAAGTQDEPARVINIGSIDGIQVPALETYSYSASKAAVHQLTRHLAKRLAPTITVNAIAPGPFESKMMAATLEAFGEQIAAERAAQAHRPARRHGRHRHLPVLAGRGLPDRRHHPGRRGHRHHSLITRPTRSTGGSLCCCCTRCTGSPAPRRRPSTRPTATSSCPALAKSDGSPAALVPAPGPRQRAAYTVVTITGCRDATAWADLADRIRVGRPGRSGRRRVDGMRHALRRQDDRPRCPGHRCQEIDLASRARRRRGAQARLFMEDTAWPFAGGLQAYLAKAGTLYDTHAEPSPEEGGHSIIELEAAFQPVYGTHTTTEVILWQRVVNRKALM